MKTKKERTERFCECGTQIGIRNISGRCRKCNIEVIRPLNKEKLEEIPKGFVYHFNNKKHHRKLECLKDISLRDFWNFMKNDMNYAEKINIHNGTYISFVDYDGDLNEIPWDIIERMYLKSMER